MRVLVTGHLGFVGKHLVRALEERGIGVVGLDRRSGWDLSWDWTIDRIASNDFDVIAHLASSCSTPGSVRAPLDTFRDTVATAANMTELARLKEVPIVITSSVKARDGMTPYGASKRMVETWAGEYAAAYGTTVVINRPGTIYGPGQEGSLESGWIAWFLRAREVGLRVTINGDGRQVRDLLHVSDYVELLVAQLTRPDLYAGAIWDVGGGSSNVVSVLEMAQYLGLDYEHGPERYGDARSYVGVNDAPGWEPRIHWREADVFRR